MILEQSILAELKLDIQQTNKSWAGGRMELTKTSPTIMHTRSKLNRMLQLMQQLSGGLDGLRAGWYVQSLMTNLYNNIKW